jgi:hypothetical protein
MAAFGARSAGGIPAAQGKPPIKARFTATNANTALVHSLNGLLADLFTLYLKTKNFHWHVKGRSSAICTCCSTSRLPPCSPSPT